MRMEDGTEIITLNFTAADDRNDQVMVHPGENEDESILGYDENMDRCEDGKN